MIIFSYDFDWFHWNKKLRTVAKKIQVRWTNSTNLTAFFIIEWYLFTFRTILPTFHLPFPVYSIALKIFSNLSSIDSIFFFLQYRKGHSFLPFNFKLWCKNFQIRWSSIKVTLLINKERKLTLLFKVTHHQLKGTKEKPDISSFDKNREFLPFKQSEVRSEPGIQHTVKDLPYTYITLSMSPLSFSINATVWVIFTPRIEFSRLLEKSVSLQSPHRL